MRTTYMDTVESARENRKWYVIDATDLVLGRMAVAVATVLKGKHKPTYTSPTLASTGLRLFSSRSPKLR